MWRFVSRLLSSSAAPQLRVVVPSDRLQWLAPALVSAAAVAAVAIIGGLVALTREMRFRREGFRLEWLKELVAAAMDIYYGGRITYMRRLSQLTPPPPPIFPPDFKDLEAKAMRAVGDLVLLGGRVGSSEIRASAEALLVHYNALPNASDVASLEGEKEAFGRSFNELRTLLYNEITRILDGGRLRRGAADPPADATAGQ